MSVPHLGVLVRRLRWLIDRPECPSPTDADVLARFVAERDEAAFELLVWRHGPAVYRLCRRMLRCEQDAEDAFQATFLTLARRAAAIGKRESVASWLYKVAYRIVLRLQQRQQRHVVVALDGQPEPVAEAECQGPDADVRMALDEEVSRLPDKYRLAVVLCYLEGKSNTEAAAELGCPRGTIDSRLAWARQRLRQRLARRGIGLSITAALGLLAGSSTAAQLPAALARATAHLGVQFAGGAAGLGSIPSILLARGVLRAMFLTKLKTLVIAVAGTAILAAASWGLVGTPAAKAQDRPPAVKEAEPPSPVGVADEPMVVETRTLRGNEGSVQCVTFSPDGRLLAVGAELQDHSGELCIWDAATGKLCAKARTAKWVRSIAVSPDSKILATAELDAVNLRDAILGRITLTVKHPTTVNAVRFAPDGKLLATATGDRMIRLWDTTGHELRKIELPDRTESLAFSPDGKVLAVADEAGGIGVWEVVTGRAILAVKGRYPHLSESVCFAPDGKTLATAAGPIVRVWDVASGKEMRVLKGHTHRARAVAFSPSGSVLASCGGRSRFDRGDNEPGEVILWDAATGKQMAVLRGYKAPISSIAFSPDGKWLASGDEAGTVKLWRVAGSAPAAAIIADRLDQLLDQLLASKRSDEQVVEALYLATLGRLPTEGEKRRVADLAAGGNRQAHFEEVLRTLLATRECRDHQETLRQRSGTAGRP
jgi:RNA polymerase sigma factor (sigma-70 family)